MAKRQYNQLCALSVGLDLIGERWTLLILRELLFGARRFSDILRGTPGLSTNLLSQRLRELEQLGLITRRKLPPPAASSVYALTDEGRDSIRPIIAAVTNLGVQFLRYPPADDQFVPASATMGAMNKFFQRGGSYTGAVEFRTEHDVFVCVIEGGVMQDTRFGEMPAAHLVISGMPDIFMGLVVGYMFVAEMLERQELNLIRGTVIEAESFFANFTPNDANIIQTP